MYKYAKPAHGLPRNSSCPVCRSSANEDIEAFTARIICPVCGMFRLSVPTGHFLKGFIGECGALAYRISHNLRTISEGALGASDNSLFPIYSDDDFKRMIAQSDLPVQEKLHLLLRYLARSSEFLGESYAMDHTHDYSVIEARDAGEAVFYIEMLKEQGFVSAGVYTNNNRGTTDFRLTGKGWLELDRITQSGSQSANAFIAISFDRSRDKASDAVHAAISEAGYMPIQINRVPHLNRIDDEIIARIRGSKFLVADFTGQSNGVYFEAGFMLGMGRPVIWLCQKQELKKVHFDARQYNTIDYLDEADLEERLKNRILANLGRGPNANH
jgi:hypothetical protein